MNYIEIYSKVNLGDLGGYLPKHIHLTQKPK